MTEDEDQTDSEDQAVWQKHQPCQGNHAETDRPDHLQDAKAVGDVKCPGEVDNDQLDEDKPKPAREQEPGCLSFILLLNSIKKCRCARQKDERRCAEVCDP